MGCYSPRHNFIGTIPNNTNMPLLWAIINTALTLLNRLIWMHSVQFLGRCVYFSVVWDSCNEIDTWGSSNPPPLTTPPLPPPPPPLLFPTIKSITFLILY